MGGPVSVEKGRETPFSLQSLCPMECLLRLPTQGPLPWGKADCILGILQPQSCSVTLRVEEVNWAAWEQTLPTLCEDPSGPGNPGK